MRKFKIGSTLFLRTLILAMAGVVFLAIGAQAQVNYTWQSSATDSKWETLTNWNNTPPNGGPNGRDNRAFIGTISNNPVHLSSTSGYSGLGYSGYVELSELNIGSSSSLSIDTGGTLTSTNIKNYGIINLNGGTLQGDPYAVQGTYLWDVVGAGKFNVTADSTLSGKFTWGVSNQLVRFNIGNVGGGTGDLGPHTLNLNGATLITNPLGAYPLVVGTGGTLNNSDSNNTSIIMGNGSGPATISMRGGSITNTGFNDSNSFIISDYIVGYGSVYGCVTTYAGITASGGKLTIDGTTNAVYIWGGISQTNGVSGDILVLKGNINFGSSGSLYANPTTGTNTSGVVQLEGATLNTTNGTGTIYGNKGQVNVVNGISTLNGAYIPYDDRVQISPKIVPDVTIKNGGGLSLQNLGSSPVALYANNFTMEQGSTLSVAANNQIQVGGNFSFQQTNPASWTDLPDLKLNGAFLFNPVTKGYDIPETLEVGGVNGHGITNNFGLNSLTIGYCVYSAYVKLVDQYANATPSGWTPGSEVLYLNSLLLGSTSNYPTTFDLNNILVYVNGVPLADGNYNGITVINAPVPIPGSVLLLGSGLLGLAGLRRFRKS